MEDIDTNDVNALLSESSDESLESNPVLSVPVRIDPEGNPIIDGEYFENNEDFKKFAAEHLKRKGNTNQAEDFVQQNIPSDSLDENLNAQPMYDSNTRSNLSTSSKPITVTDPDLPLVDLKKKKDGGKSRKARKAKKSKGGKSKKARKSLRRK